MRRLLAAATLGVALVAGCSRATPDNYAKIEAGMTRDEVHEILGKPDEVSGSGIGNLTFTHETWNGRDYVIAITYAGDSVSLKSIEKRGKP